MQLRNKIPTIGQLKKIPSVLSLKEKAAIALLFFILIGFFVWKTAEFYLETSVIAPVKGGAYIEGIIGAPQYINPVISQANDTDEVISKLVYSSLFRFDSEGKLANDLADGYKIAEDGKSYEISLKKNVRWHDGEALTADDIIYTASIIKDPNYQSSLRVNLEGMSFEKIDDYNIVVKTKSVFGQALSALTFGILPKHKWEKISAENFTLALLNIKPIGSGFYIFENFAKDQTGRILYYQLRANDDYYREKPLIEKAVFKFYSTSEEVLTAYNKEEIMAIGGISPSEEASLDKNLGKVFKAETPQYFAVFFNANKSKPLADKIVRLALAHSVDKKRLIKEVFKEAAISLEGPYPPFLPGYNPNTKIYDFAPEHAKNILEAQGWIDADKDGIREKDGVNLEFSLLTGDSPELAEAAKEIGAMWMEIGAKAEIKIIPVNELTVNYIRTREYDAMLFGEILSLDPNPFIFWHSSQRKDPGLNLAVYFNKDVDKILEETETLTDSVARAEKYKQFQALVIEDIPAVFLYSPYYLLEINNKIKGVKIKSLAMPTERLNEINKWHINTERIRK